MGTDDELTDPNDDTEIRRARKDALISKLAADQAKHDAERSKHKNEVLLHHAKHNNDVFFHNKFLRFFRPLVTVGLCGLVGYELWRLEPDQTWGTILCCLLITTIVCIVFAESGPLKVAGDMVQTLKGQDERMIMQQPKSKEGMTKAEGEKSGN